MDKQLNTTAKILIHQLVEPLDFLMRLMNIEVPGHRQMAVKMQGGAIFYDPQVVQVNPVLPPIGLLQADHVFQ